MHPPGLGLDVGRGASPLVGVRHLFLSHGHLDHALGSPLGAFAAPPARRGRHARLLSGSDRRRPRAIRRGGGGARARRIRAARSCRSPPATASSSRAASRSKPSTSTTWCRPSAVHLIRRRSSLAPELAGLAGEEIARRRAAGEAVEVEREEILLSYCGDTGAGLFDLAPKLGASRVVLVECTFAGEEALARGAAYGHLHVDDLAAHADRLAGYETVVLHHRSRRHAAAELRGEIERLAPELAARVVLFPDAPG